MLIGGWSNQLNILFNHLDVSVKTGRSFLAVAICSDEEVRNVAMQLAEAVHRATIGKRNRLPPVRVEIHRDDGGNLVSKPGVEEILSTENSLYFLYGGGRMDPTEFAAMLVGRFSERGVPLWAIAWDIAPVIIEVVDKKLIALGKEHPGLQTLIVHFF